MCVPALGDVALWQRQRRGVERSQGLRRNRDCTRPIRIRSTELRHPRILVGGVLTQDYAELSDAMAPVDHKLVALRRVAGLTQYGLRAGTLLR